MSFFLIFVPLIFFGGSGGLNFFFLKLKADHEKKMESMLLLAFPRQNGTRDRSRGCSFIDPELDGIFKLEAGIFRNLEIWYLCISARGVSSITPLSASANSVRILARKMRKLVALVQFLYKVSFF